ncbi:serine hydrolase domain-containing protein [Maritimibacter fusiformis]|uniref:Serine hydrolase n=1 Tax=Maritimibacter fusiformis TaxID=2603819 RepID=A0A5D0RHT6_9RHOB|nr:serine hydrolase [Maritimibacter fusiformis]TYB81072.1 serine hydrolase [Maritimibacter fusiformis]
MDDNLTGFEETFGFTRREVGLDNWRKAPFSRWAFSHVREIVPTAPINTRRTNQSAPDFGTLLGERADDDATGATIAEQIKALDTDVLLACKDGRPVALWQAPHADANDPHLIFSVSKSVTGLIAGALAAAGALDLGAPVIDLVPEAAGSAFADASVRNLLDMRVSLEIDEVYGDDAGWGGRYCRAVLWDPPVPGEDIDHLSLLLAIGKGHEAHGGPFRYRSANSDLLGVVIERAAGQPFNGVAANLLWTPVQGQGEASITVDRRGMAQSAGGISCTAFDLARLGDLLRTEGVADGNQVLPAAFVHDTLHGGDADAWRAGDWGKTMPGHRYRNQWYARGDADGCLFAKGIHGQWVHVNPARRTTIVKLSSQDVAKADSMNAATLALLDTLAARI